MEFRKGINTMKTEQELRLLLAKKLPEKILISETVEGPRLLWRDSLDKILDTEWDYIVGLVEDLIPATLRWQYLDHIPGTWADKVKAKWSQRAQAMYDIGFLKGE